MEHRKRLKAPLSFQGGKQRVADKIVNTIKGDLENTQYIDLCCGSGAISVELVNQGVHPEDILMVDASDWGDFWSQVSWGSFDLDWFENIIDSVPKDKNLIKSFLEDIAREGYNKEDDIDIIPYWLLLQAGSFGGKHIWTENGKFCNASFRNYWQPTATSRRRSPVNPMMPMPDTLLLQVKAVVESMSPIKAMRGRVEELDWRNIEKVRKKEKVVVFIDPPYEGTTGYGFNLDYVQWYKDLELPDNYSLYITDYVAHGKHYWNLSKTSKGGIYGGDVKRGEILSRIF